MLRRVLMQAREWSGVLALFIALGTGGAYAADLIGPRDIGPNAVRSKHIKAGNVKTGDLGANAVTAQKVAEGTLTGDQLSPGFRLPQGCASGQVAKSDGGNLWNCAADEAGPPDFGYIFNIGAQVVPIEADVAFDTNGVLDGFTHTPGAAQLVASTAGTYGIGFSVSGAEPNQFAIFVNGAASPMGVYGSGAGTQQNTGHGILTLAAGDAVTLRNHSSAAAVTLQTLAGGTQANVNASILIQKLD